MKGFYSGFSENNFSLDGISQAKIEKAVSFFCVIYEEYLEVRSEMLQLQELCIDENKLFVKKSILLEQKSFVSKMVASKSAFWDIVKEKEETEIMFQRFFEEVKNGSDLFSMHVANVNGLINAFDELREERGEKDELFKMQSMKIAINPVEFFRITFHIILYNKIVDRVTE